MVRKEVVPCLQIWQDDSGLLAGFIIFEDEDRSISGNFTSLWGAIGEVLEAFTQRQVSVFGVVGLLDQIEASGLPHSNQNSLLTLGAPPIKEIRQVFLEMLLENFWPQEDFAKVSSN
ncbi:MAG: hypothetical protein WDZ85_01855 [Candidatus Paceibacterota bacterium]